MATATAMAPVIVERLPPTQTQTLKLWGRVMLSDGGVIELHVKRVGTISMNGRRSVTAEDNDGLVWVGAVDDNGVAEMRMAR